MMGQLQRAEVGLEVGLMAGFTDRYPAAIQPHKWREKAIQKELGRVGRVKIRK